MYIKKTISIPEDLAHDAETYLVGRYYSNLSEVIRDGIRQLLHEYKNKQDVDSVIDLYKEGQISLRDVTDTLNLPLRETMELLANKGVYLRYGEKELAEDFE